tara:strand:- start:508 stop:1644 length:1137 start_codon:yes stop_codon:yes gene_type:complete
MYQLYLTCPRGLEEVLYNETKEYISQKINIDNGGIIFNGDLEDIYKINYKTRMGMNLHRKLFEGYISSYDDLYKIIYHFNWNKILSPENTFSIKTKIQSDIFQKSNFCTMKGKDAIVDRIRKEKNSRPSIDKRNPDFYIFIYIKNKKIKVFLNSSGWPLFMRGYRTKIHKAALNESLAAGILKLTNWNKKDALYDPFCGSGTFLIEAAMDALNIPPRTLRNFYAFKNWKNYDETLWKKVITNEQKNIIQKKINLYGSDLISQNIELANQSIKKLDLTDSIIFEKKNFQDVIPLDKKGVFICNPPYGYRIGDMDKLKVLYKQIGDHLKTNFKGFDTFILTGNLELLKHVGLRTKKKIILKNGMIDSRLAYYPIKDGNFK